MADSCRLVSAIDKRHCLARHACYANVSISFDMSSSASRQQCADANAVMWSNAAIAAVRAVSAQTLVAVGTFTNHAGAMHLPLISKQMTWACNPLPHLFCLAQLATAAPMRCCHCQVRQTRRSHMRCSPCRRRATYDLIFEGDRRFPLRIASFAQFSNLGKLSPHRVRHFQSISKHGPQPGLIYCMLSYVRCRLFGCARLPRKHGVSGGFSVR